MADLNHDGSITFNTKLDNSGIQKDLNELEKKIEKSEREIEKSSTEKFPLEDAAKRLSSELEEATRKLDELKLKQEAALRLAPEAVQTDPVLANVKVDDSSVDKDLKSIRSKIQKAAEEIQKYEEIRLPLSRQSEELGAALDGAKAKLADLQAEQARLAAALTGTDPQSYIDAYAQKLDADAAVADQFKEVNRLQKEWDAVTDKADRYEEKIRQADTAIQHNNAVLTQLEAAASVRTQRIEIDRLNTQLNQTNQKIASYDTKIKRATADLRANTAAAGKLSAKLTSGGAKLSAALDKAHLSANKLHKRLFSLVGSTLFFSVVTAGLMKIREHMGKVLKTNEEYTAQLAKLKGALLTAFQPVYETLLPGLIAAMRIATALVQVIAHIFSLLRRSTSSESAENAEALNDEAEAIENVGGAAKKAGKDLAAFDEINRLGGGENAGGAGASGLDPDFDEFNTEEYKAKIDELTVYISGALLALGAILAFSGANIPLGIALMALGAVGLAAEIKENWGAMSKSLQKALTKTLTILGGAFLVIGAILAFSGASVPKGIALMALGAASLAGAAAINWNTIVEALKGPIGGTVALLSVATLALGAIIAFSGANIPLGIALMAVGAAGLATVAAVNWDTISQTLQGPVGGVVALVGGALLMVGAILAFSGVALPLGITLMAVGALALGTAAATNWSTVENYLTGPIGNVIAMASTALLALGVILAFSGVALPLGIALIALGAAGLAGSYTIDWNALKTKIQETWEGIKHWWKTNVAQYFTKKYWVDKIFSAISEALPESWKAGINATIKAVNDFLRWVEDALTFDIPPIEIAGETIFGGATIKLVDLPEIPYLAKGAVLPANKPFLAMVGDQKHGTNVEAPLSTIQEAVAIVMEDMIQSNIAGHEATVEMLRAILEAIYELDTSDERYAKAVDSFNRKMAVAKGGA